MVKESKKRMTIDEIAAVCSDCGACLFACPVYNAELVEPTSPRGKVNLVKSLRDGRLKPGRLNKKLLYQCALCGSCEHICSKGVEFVDMMIDYRTSAAGGKRIPWLKKAILRLYHSVIFKHFIWVVDVLARTPLRDKFTIPRRRKANLGKLYSKRGWQPRPIRTCVGSGLNQGMKKKFVFFARFWKVLIKKPDQKHYDILFFPGCVLTYFYPEVVEKSVAFLREKGFSVVIPKGMACCGFPYLSQGWKERFITFRRKNQKIFSRFDFKYLVVPCGTGVMTFRNYYDFENQSIEIYEMTEFFYRYVRGARDEVVNPGPSKSSKVTFHDPCHHLKSLGIGAAPRFFLERLGENFIDDKSGLCCGFGGLFSVGFPSTSKKILKRREEALKELGVDVVVTACPGCYMQLRENTDREVKFFIDLFSPKPS